MAHVPELCAQFFRDAEVLALGLPEGELLYVPEGDLVVGRAEVHEISQPHILQPLEGHHHFPGD